MDVENIIPVLSHTKRHRGSREFVTPKLLAALDKCKISDRDAVHIIISTAEVGLMMFLN